jgi:segregation and condensation protein B
MSSTDPEPDKQPILPFPTSDWEVDDLYALLAPDYEPDLPPLLSPTKPAPEREKDPVFLAFPNRVEEQAAPPRWERILEAILFVSPGPLSIRAIQSAIRGISTEEIEVAIQQLNQRNRLQNRAYMIGQRDDGYELQLKINFQHLFDRARNRSSPREMDSSTVETLAIIAYRQPMSRNELDSLRGTESGTAIKQLIRLGWIRQLPLESGSSPTYATTDDFLKQFQLETLEELPQIGPFAKWTAP